MNTYNVVNLTNNLSIKINAESLQQALCLVDFHESKTSIVTLLHSNIKNNNVSWMVDNYRFNIGVKSIALGDWCILL